MENPASYEIANGLQRKDANNFTEEFRKRLGRMSGRILDIGSGPGDVTLDFILPKLNSMAILVCSDISESMVKFSREKYKDNRRVSFVQLDIETPDLPANMVDQFDGITSIYCLHWCRNMRQAFENIFKLLQSGGSALMTLIADSPIYDSYKHLAEDHRYQLYMKDVDLFIPVFHHVDNQRDTLEKLVTNVGFEIRHCSVRERNYTFMSRDMFTEFMLALNPFIARMPTSLKEEYKRDLVELTVRYNIPSQKYMDNQHGVSIAYSAFVVHLKKPDSGQVVLKQIIL